MWGKQTSHTDRMADAAKAKKALLAKARAKDPRNDPEFAERQAKRKALADAREARLTERKAAKLAEKKRIAEEKEAKILAEQQATEAEAASKLANAEELKARRDAKYAARKARQGRKR